MADGVKVKKKGKAEKKKKKAGRSETVAGFGCIYKNQNAGAKELVEASLYWIPKCGSSCALSQLHAVARHGSHRQKL